MLVIRFSCFSSCCLALRSDGFALQASIPIAKSVGKDKDMAREQVLSVASDKYTSMRQLWKILHALLLCPTEGWIHRLVHQVVLGHIYISVLWYFVVWNILVKTSWNVGVVFLPRTWWPTSLQQSIVLRWGKAKKRTNVFIQERSGKALVIRAQFWSHISWFLSQVHFRNIFQINTGMEAVYLTGQQLQEIVLKIWFCYPSKSECSTEAVMTMKTCEKTTNRSLDQALHQ